MKAAIKSLLLAQAGVVALVGLRVYTDTPPQGCAWPFISVIRLNVGPDQTLEGPLGADRGLWQIDCYAKTGTEADTLASAVRVIDGFRGLVAGKYVHSIVLQPGGVRDFSYLENDGSDRAAHRRSMDFFIVNQIGG